MWPMKKKPRKWAEGELYQPIAQFLSKQRGCDPDHLWWAGCGRDLAFPAGFGKRKPDVVAISRQERREEVHLVEAKLLKLRTTAFDDTVSQLDSLCLYADCLWAAFPKADWEKEHDNQQVWIGKLRKRGFGLLLVSESVEQEVQPAKNQEVDRSRKRQLLDALLGEEEQPVPLPSLGPEAAKAAGKAAARIAEVMDGPVREVLGGRAGNHKLLMSEVYSSTTALFTLGSATQGNVFLQGDPFGWHLQDGRPVVWVWRYSTSLTSNSAPRAKIESDLLIGSYLYAATPSGDEWICRPIRDCDLASIRARGYTDDACVGRPLAISDRKMAGIKKDLKALLTWARKLPK
jgi:hypothetical protein